MKVISGLNNLESSDLKDTAVTIGTFDGVHLGHLKIIETLLEISRSKNLRSVLVTFSPHPQMVLGKRGPTELLTTLDEKLELLEKTGIDTVIVLEFNRQLAMYPPEDFVCDILLNKVGMKALVFGYDHAFGKDRAGNQKVLMELAERLNFSFTVVPEYKTDGEMLKSTPIRKKLKNGDFKEALQALGYNYFISGKIIEGRGVGKTLGFPTMNVGVPPGKLLPKEGVYAATARFNGDIYKGMAYIGQRLTFDDKTLTVEINLFDFDGKIDNDNIVLTLHEFIRSPEKFGSADELVEKMKSDKEIIERLI